METSFGQSDLFHETALASERHLQLFETWIASTALSSTPLSAESAGVYRDMWTALVRWCVTERVSLTEISAADLKLYLRSRAGRSGRDSDLEARYAWRVLRLVELVLQHWARSADQSPNSAVAELLKARPDIRFANSSDDEPAPEYLEAGDARALVALLAKAPATGSWKDQRDRCAVALHLGAGLTPGEVRALQVTDVHGLLRGTRKIRVAGNGTVQAHEAPVADWAWRVLQTWMATRKDIGVHGNVLLPSTRAVGRGWGKTGHYEAVKGIMALAGLLESGGAYRLRHTFALRQLRRGRKASDVAAWLGVDEAAVDRYRHVIYGTVEVV